MFKIVFYSAKVAIMEKFSLNYVHPVKLRRIYFGKRIKSGSTFAADERSSDIESAAALSMKR
jgi:hypothetical protein